MFDRKIIVPYSVTKTNTYIIVRILAWLLILPFSLTTEVLMFVGRVAREIDNFLYIVFDKLIRVFLLLVNCEGVKIERVNK